MKTIHRCDIPAAGGVAPGAGVTRGAVRWLGWVVGSLLGVVVGGTGVAESFPPAQLEFFEKRVRPVLAERCYSCHSVTSEKLKAGLHVDSRAALLKGGESGKPSVVPGHPEKSLLLEAVRYSNTDLQMPPKGRLPETQVADLEEWIRTGAAWPEGEAGAVGAASKPAFDLQRRAREHWVWQPVRMPTPPDVKDGGWVRTVPDRFILARLEGAGLTPAERSSRHALLRRLTMDLTGLPPRPAEVLEFESDGTQGAYERVVDRLLASPRFGERWARHWLDLVRYAETLGHEFDYDNPNAWRYRDYVVRALNADVPYDQWAREHIAGDLLEPPRRHPVDGFNESVMGTAFYWLGQREHSPVDIRLHQAEVVDNQIDVLSKTFLGVTVACARCHDHKFDAISARDYYAFYGMLSSSRYAQQSVDPSGETLRLAERLKGMKPAIRRAAAAYWEGLVTAPGFAWPGTNKTAPPVAGEVVLRPGETRLVFGQPGTGGDGRRFRDWFAEGEAFREAGAVPGDFMVGNVQNPVALIAEQGGVHDGLVSRRLQGALRSPTFVLERKYIHFLAAGRESRINLPVEGFTMIRDPIYGGLKKVLNHDQPRWVTMDVSMWLGRRAYVELSDVPTPDPSDDGHRNGFALDGWISLADVIVSDSKTPPDVVSKVGDAEVGVTELLGLVRAWGRGEAVVHPALRRLAALGIAVAEAGGSAAARLRGLVQEYLDLEARVPNPVRVPSMVDGNGLDEPVFVRGSHRTPGEVVPRRFLEAVHGAQQTGFERGSGRLELARRVTSRDNPLFARVAVNRVWHHLMGRGIVATPDDMGVLGQRPTHPELLDWLAGWFQGEGGYSTKRLVKMVVMSSAYQMSSRPEDPKAQELDPANLLWHRMPIRRLEGEAIRDSILALSGRLDVAMYGKPVKIHLTEFMDGRGRPGASGPLDGDGRRSLYVEVRRNFVSPMFRAFDTPVPYTTIGKRTVSNVPAQSLMLMNDPFVVGEARRWARAVLRETAGASGAEDRIRRLYLEAYGRSPSPEESRGAVDFVESQERMYRTGRVEGDPVENAWADLCHALMNVKEFVFLQ